MKHPFKAPAKTALALLLSLSTLALSACSSESRTPESRLQATALAGQPFTLFAAGDIADCGGKTKNPAQSKAAKTAAMIRAHLEQDEQSAVITLGDHTYPIGVLQEFFNCYDATWGQFKRRTYPSPGNHEYYTPNAIGYYSYFGEAAGPARRGYYSFDLGKWHIVSLNSMLKGEQHAAQIAWLRQDLERNKSLCTLAYWHHPLFSSGGHGNNPRLADMWDLLQQHGTDLVLVAHDHDYERFAPQDSKGRRDEKNGLRQIVVGTGGARLTQFWPLRAGNSEVSNNKVHGVLKLALYDNGYQWNFMAAEDGIFSDHGSALCR